MSANRAEPTVPRQSRWMAKLTWLGVDRYRALTYFAAFGLAVGVLLAVLGLPPIDLHGPLHRQYGIMGPLCGGTRALRYTMLGQWELAWQYNPLSPVLVAGAVAAMARHLLGRLTGKWLTIDLRVPLRVVVLILVALVVLLEINQQSHASLLLGS